MIGACSMKILEESSRVAAACGFQRSIAANDSDHQRLVYLCGKLWIPYPHPWLSIILKWLIWAWKVSLALRQFEMGWYIFHGPECPILFLSLTTSLCRGHLLHFWDGYGPNNKSPLHSASTRLLTVRGKCRSQVSFELCGCVPKVFDDQQWQLSNVWAGQIGMHPNGQKLLDGAFPGYNNVSPEIYSRCNCFSGLETHGNIDGTLQPE